MRTSSSSTISLIVLAGLVATGIAAADYSAEVITQPQDDDSGGATTASAKFDCTRDILEIVSSVPTASGPLLSYLLSYQATATYPLVTNACAAAAAAATASSGSDNNNNNNNNTPLLPQSLSATFSRYEDDVRSWYSAESRQIQHLITACSALPAFQTLGPFIDVFMSATGTPVPCYERTASGRSSVVPTTTTTSTSTSTTGPGTATPTVNRDSMPRPWRPTRTPAGAASLPRATVGVAMAAAGVIGAAILI